MTHRPPAMFQLYFASLIMYMGVSSQMHGSEMKRDTAVDLATVLNRVDQLEARLHSTTSALQTTMDDLAATKTQLALKTKNVAFSAYIKRDKQSGSNLPVKFDGIDYNAGNGYSITTGKFTAPVSGTYTFSAVVMTHMTSGATYMQIIQSGSRVSAGYGYFVGNFITIPVSVIIHLKQAEQVWVDSTSDVLLPGGFHSCHFVGTLLSTD